MCVDGFFAANCAHWIRKIVKSFPDAIYMAKIFMTKAVGDFHRADPNEIYKAAIIQADNVNITRDSYKTHLDRKDCL
jgi:hypothetical protein